MGNWFTVEKIAACTYAISEYKHWEETHCYLLCGTEKALLIDTGLGISNIKTVVEGLTQLPVTVVATHLHWDHIGGHKYFNHVQVHQAEQNWITDQFPIPLQVVKQNLTRVPCSFPTEFSVDNYQIFQGVPEKTYADGDWFDLGNRRLIVVHTPGHSPGHCCFYEPERKWLYSGDLIYSGCLDAFYPTTDPQLFFRSIKRIQALSIDRIWPAHHRLDLPTDFVHKIAAAFGQLKNQGRLQHGQGIFHFDGFQIHI